MKEAMFYLHKPMMGYTNADNKLKIVLSMRKNGKSESLTLSLLNPFFRTFRIYDIFYFQTEFTGYLFLFYQCLNMG
jgi:hypothetical protein